MNKSTIQKRINVLQKVYTDLNNGKYPGKGYASFAHHYKGDTYFWKSMAGIGVIDFEKPSWNPVFAPNITTVKKVYLYYDKHFSKAPEPLKAAVAVKKLQKAVNTHAKQTPAKPALKPVEKKAVKEISILWGLFKYKVS